MDNLEIASTNISNGDLVRVVVAKYKENVEWTLKCPFQTIIYSKNIGEPNYVHEGKDSETSSYFRYIIDHYDNLSEWTLFLHGHETHWHHTNSVLKSCDIDIQKVFDSKKCKFLSINHDGNPKNPRFMVHKPNVPTPSELSGELYKQVMIDMFGKDEYNAILLKHFPPNETLLNKQSYPMAAQFYVHKSRIQARPKSFYENCFNMCTDKSYILGIMAKTTQYIERTIAPFFFEANWHYIFGEDYLYTSPYMRYNDIPFRNKTVDVN